MQQDRADARHILMIVTSHDELGATGAKTGLWLEELAAPYLCFRDRGFTVSIASPKGGAAPIDPTSLSKDFLTESARRFQADGACIKTLATTTPLGQTDDSAAFDALFFVGGHGTMWDFFPNDDIARLLDVAQRRGTPVAAVCHGVAALLNPCHLHSIKGVRLTGFSDAEEAAVGLTGVVPFLLEQALGARGAAYVSGPAFGVHAVEDGRFLTGQNPASSLDVAKMLIRRLAR
jgi:putative intracellular protease/amidase